MSNAVIYDWLDEGVGVSGGQCEGMRPSGPSLSDRQPLADSEMAQDGSTGVTAGGGWRGTPQGLISGLPRAITSGCGSLSQLAHPSAWTLLRLAGDRYLARP
jgi:hypothetical protein